jgi:hypothetical protein
MIWNRIIPNKDNSVHLKKRHVSNSWFLFKKCESNNAFINEWVSLISNPDFPIVTYHITGDQSIFNILVIKYNLPVFYSKDIKYNTQKDKNVVLNIINNSENVTEYFIYLNIILKFECEYYYIIILQRYNIIFLYFL